MLGTDKNCNFCGDACQLAHAQSACLPGMGPLAFVCTLQSCVAGWGDCDMFASNGCETDTTSDPNNCGGCGVVCGAGAECVMSACVVVDAGGG
jgi:hypothetical protein